MVHGATAEPRAVQEPRDRGGAGSGTDELILGRFLSLNGSASEAAFASIVERHGPMVLRVCHDVIGEREEAKDAAQAVFLVLASRARSIRKPGALSPWLHGVALRVSRRARAVTNRRKVAERRKAESMHHRHTQGAVNDPLVGYAELHEEVDRLPEDYRRPLILCYLEGMTQAEAAQALGWPLGTVQIRLHRGRERLRSRLTRRGIGLGALGFFPSSAVMSQLVGREWTNTTATAALQFAAGHDTAGLVSPSVTSLARSALTPMLSAKVIASMTLVLIGFMAIAFFTNSRRGQSHVQASKPELATALTVRPIPTTRDDRRSELPATKSSLNPGPGAASPRSTPVPEEIRQEPTSKDPEETSEPARASVRYLAANPVQRVIEKEPVRGSELFDRDWMKDDSRSHGGDGLGPVFNGTSCVACHFQGGTGGAGGIDQNIEIATLLDRTNPSSGFFYSFSMDFGAGQFQYQMGNPAGRSTRSGPGIDPVTLAAIHPGFRHGRSVVLHRYGTDPAYNTWRGAVPGQHGTVHVRISQRNPTPLFGVGLIDSISDEVIEAAAKKKYPSSTGIRGRVSRLKDGRIGRFGWKAQTATLKEFVMSAASGEMGLDLPDQRQASDPRFPKRRSGGPDMDFDECEALVAFVRELPAPGAIKPVDEHEATQIKAGADLFKTIGCTHCHIPNLGGVEGIYSDLLLHDMSPVLEDVGNYAVFIENSAKANAEDDGGDPSAAGSASVREWRTSPLWGLKDSGPYLHDGRASSIEQAIALHAGQGATSARRHADLSPRRKRQLYAFLKSLAAPTRQP